MIANPKFTTSPDYMCLDWTCGNGARQVVIARRIFFSLWWAVEEYFLIEGHRSFIFVARFWSQARAKIYLKARLIELEARQ